jgi:serine/threonine protein kinase
MLTTDITPTKEWLLVERYLSSKQYNVLLGSLRNIQYKNVIIKFGEVADMNKEYTLSKLAYEHNVPNFIKFICAFTCEDDIENIKTRDFTIHNYICKNKGDSLGVIIMPYYHFGSLNNYRWTKDNFHILKSTLRQVVYSILFAFEKFGFVHGDLHLDNIILRNTNKKTIEYESRSLHTNGLYALIMDFGLSSSNVQNTRQIYLDLKRVFSLVYSMNNSDIILDCNSALLLSLSGDCTMISQSVYDALDNIIDNITIIYAKSEKPPEIDFRAL